MTKNLTVISRLDEAILLGSSLPCCTRCSLYVRFFDACTGESPCFPLFLSSSFRSYLACTPAGPTHTTQSFHLVPHLSSAPD